MVTKAIPGRRADPVVQFSVFTANKLGRLHDLISLLASHAVTIGGKQLDSLAATLRALPRPVIGRLAEGRLWLDCRCLEPAEEPAFVAQLPVTADIQ